MRRRLEGVTEMDPKNATAQTPLTTSAVFARADVRVLVAQEA